MAVLIIMTWLSHSQGAVTTTQEFTSMERCEEARATMVDQYGRWNTFGSNNVRTFCVAK